jgi:hypothetical protein
MSKKNPSKRRRSLTLTPQKTKRQGKAEESALGGLRGKTQIVGDIVSPVCPPEDWQGDLNNFDKPRRQS